MKTKPTAGTSNKVVYCADVCADFHTGSKEALISEGVCKASWFPAKLGTDNQGRTKRTYRIEGRQPETTLTHRRDSKGMTYWIARVEISDQEHQRRMEERDNRWKRITAPERSGIVSTTIKPTPEELSMLAAFELLSERQRAAAYKFVMAMARRAQRVEQPKEQTKFQHLRLVVNNDAPRP